ncbi:protein kinase [Actinomadura sp. LD22]|uniref:Protein kinase n=1 Tax=Actinomadura physcomitrii TaxID=2650748 RepID=A0A6I4MME7_9ACTN|nr:serine/threonine-protein kinase [Actinomadura physcomitrii]MWA04731.1 protein kinase [Actinomadura physcomitrii]
MKSEGTGPLRPGDPENVGGYALAGLLGEGGMGQVFLGRTRAGRLVAVKLIRPEYARQETFRERFAREVEAARKVGGFHTALVVDADPLAPRPWMATAYIPGPSLQTHVDEHGGMDAADVRRIGAQLVEGLSAIHACGLVHRDLKPSNVILGEDGARIIDFGIARAVDARTLTAAGSMIGSYAYMSPEQVQGAEVTPAGDVFSLGSVLAFMAGGKAPFRAESVPGMVNGIVNGDPDLTAVPDSLKSRCCAGERCSPPGRPESSRRCSCPWSCWGASTGIPRGRPPRSPRP